VARNPPTTRLAIGGALALVALAARSSAATIVVNDNSDTLHSPGCATTGTGTCALRDAIMFANANSGSDAIHFAVAASGVVTIFVTSQLPTIVDPVSVDATTEPGFAGSPLVELSGQAAGPGTFGLSFDAGSAGSSVKGLVIHSFGAAAILITRTQNVTVQGNFIGTNPAGTSARPNLTGVSVQSADGNRIGGSGLGKAT
jgi:hypothetical protein